jgi:isopentenyl diphosphate isomerase/L-lactate dehydrogenase-like FMN-dependent dehydrogenase
VEPVNVWDYERLAEERLDPGAWGYYAGGSGDESTLRENVAAYGRWSLRPRVLVDVAGATTTTDVIGQELALPLLIAPVAFQRMAHPDGEAGMARAARDAGTVLCLSTMTTTSLADVAAQGSARWFQLYVFRDGGITRHLVEQAREHGFGAIVLTVDTPMLGRRERDLRTGFTIAPEVSVASIGRSGVTPREAFAMVSPSVTWPDVGRLAMESGLPVVLKGIQTGEDARLAADHGAAAIVVSNHGGRQLDGVPATIDLLPECVEAVDRRIPVLVDGGIRRGSDVVKALALGARAALAGRPLLWGLAVGGEAGARHVLELLREEIRLALALLGCSSPADVRREHVVRRG